MWPDECKPGQIYKIWIAENIPKYVVVVSRESLNRGDRCITVLLTTKKVVERARLDNCVFIRAGDFGLKEDCVAQCETLAITYYDDFVYEEGLIGTLDSDRWEELISALGYVMDAACHTV